MFRRSLQDVSTRRGQTTMLYALLTVIVSFTSINNVMDHPSRAQINLGVWRLWLSLVLGWVFGVPNGFLYSKKERSSINDELVRSHQASAAKFGLAFCLIALLAISVLALTQGKLPIWTVPAATSSTVVVTGLFFSWLQMRDD